MLGSEVVFVAIAIIGVIAASILIAPFVVWLRTRVTSRRNEGRREIDSDATIDLHPMAAGAGAGVGAADGLIGQDVPLAEGDAATSAQPGEPSDGAAHDRIIRIVSWSFLMAVAVFAAVSGVWVATLPAIVILVAVTGQALVVLQDVLPMTRLRTARGPLQAILAIAFASVLVDLTGGLESPFTFTFPLIVGAGALVTAPRMAVLLTLAVAAAYLAAGLVGTPEPASGPLIQLLVNTTGIFLLAYVGVSVGREHRRARDAAIRLSTVDSLTGLFNRSFFFTALERELARGDRSGRAFSLVMLDLDDLKTINDRSGHHAGDQVLRNVADIIRSRTRKIDVAARYGGDEFVALLPETDPTGGWVFAEKIRMTVAEQGMPGVEPGPTISIGVVSYPADGRTADALVGSADRAMYNSKRGGKNKVTRASGERVAIAIEADEVEPSRQGRRPG